MLICCVLLSATGPIPHLAHRCRLQLMYLLMSWDRETLVPCAAAEASSSLDSDLKAIVVGCADTPPPPNKQEAYVVMQILSCSWLLLLPSRSAEDCRNFGPQEPKVKQLIQGGYSNEWVDKNLARQVGVESAVVCCSSEESMLVWQLLRCCSAFSVSCRTSCPVIWAQGSNIEQAANLLLCAAQSAARQEL